MTTVAGGVSGHDGGGGMGMGMVMAAAVIVDRVVMTADILTSASVVAGGRTVVKVKTMTMMKTSTGGGQGCVGRCGGGRALAAAAFTVTKLDRHPGGHTNDVTHPIRGNNQLMMIVGGGEDKRGGQLWGIG